MRLILVNNRASNGEITSQQCDKAIVSVPVCLVPRENRPGEGGSSLSPYACRWGEADTSVSSCLPCATAMPSE